MKRFFLTGILAAALAVVGAPKAEAANLLQIQFSGMDFMYNGSNLCDAAGCNAAPGAPNFALADPLITMSFILNGVTLGTFLGPASQIGIDFNIGVGTLVVDTQKAGTGGFMDLYVNGTWGLALDISTWTVLLSSTGIPFSVLGSAEVTNIFGQNLPFGLTMLTPVEISFSANNATGTSSSFTASGTGEADGPAAVPEPGSMILLGSGLLGLAAAARRMRKA